MSVLRATLGVVRVANAADKLSLPCTFRIQRVELGFGTTAPVRRLSEKYDYNRTIGVGSGLLRLDSHLAQAGSAWDG